MFVPWAKGRKGELNFEGFPLCQAHFEDVVENEPAEGSHESMHRWF